MAGELVDGGVVKEVGVVFQAAEQASVDFHEREGDVEDGGAALDFEGLGAFGGELAGEGGLVEQLEGDLKERVAAEVAFGGEGFHERFKGQFLVGVGAEGGFADAVEYLGEGGVVAEVGAQDQ